MGVFIDRSVILQIAGDGYKKNNFDQNTFKKDVHLFFVVRKMTKRFLTKGVINDKLLINNIIICLNVFGINKTNVIFRTICDDSEFGIIKTFLIFLKSFNLSNDKTNQNKIIKDILQDITYRYHLQPKEEHINENNDNTIHFESFNRTKYN